MTEISKAISNDFKAIKSNATIAEVHYFFQDFSYSHFPVLDEDVYIGSIASDDIETFDLDKKVSDYRYGLESFFVRDTMNWLDVLEVFAKNNTNILPVLNERNDYIGYYEIENIIKFFYQTPFLKEKGGIIVIKRKIQDYSMSQITQIVESNNGKLLGLFISGTDSETIQVTLKLSLGEINDIIQSFRRYNYEIVSDHDEDNYLSVLKERSEYLDKYLNI